MKPCGGCNLCCRLESVDAIGKPKGQLCQHQCQSGACAIYPDRPVACRDFLCLWKTDDALPESARPDKAHLYAARVSEEAYKIVVDPNYPRITEAGSAVIDRVCDLGFHAIVMSHNNINLKKGKGRDLPQRLILDWII